MEEPALDARVGELVQAQAVPPVGAEGAVGEAALQQLGLRVDSLVSPQVARATEPLDTPRTHVRLLLAGNRLRLILHHSNLVKK